MGTFYPPDLPTSVALPFYQQIFDTVEVNATFHAVPPPNTVRGWLRRTPPHFAFALKFPRLITHDLRLQVPDALPPTRELLNMARLLGPRLGPLLLQLPPSFRRTPDNRRALAQYLDRLPLDEVRVAVELRHPSWAVSGVEKALAERRVAWCLADGGPTSRLALFPTDFTYIRWNRSGHVFQGYAEIQVDRSEDLDWWAQTLLSVPSHVQTVYGYMSNEFAGHAPASLRALQERLGLPTRDPRLAWPQRPLL